MANLSANRDSKRSVGEVQAYAGASGIHLYAGGIAQINTAGYLVNASGTTANRFAGVAWDEMNNTSTNKKLASVSNGGLYGRVYIKGVFTLAANGTPAVTDIGKVVYVVDDQTVGTSAAGYCPVGRVMDFGTNTYRVLIDGEIGKYGCYAGASGFWVGA